MSKPVLCAGAVAGRRLGLGGGEDRAGAEGGTGGRASGVGTGLRTVGGRGTGWGEAQGSASALAGALLVRCWLSPIRILGALEPTPA